jgi:hypothetical protein
MITEITKKWYVITEITKSCIWFTQLSKITSCQSNHGILLHIW